MAKKKVIPIVVIAAAAAVAALVVPRWLDTDNDRLIRISGNIELTEVNVAFRVSGKLVERLVDEGDSVQQGRVVARLDQEQLLRARDREQAALTAARSQLEQLHTAIDYQRETLEGQIAQRKAELRQAEALLRELEAGSREQEIQLARARLAEARTEYERAAGDWERAQPLYKADDISRAQYDQFQARHAAATAQVKQAEEALALVVEGPRKETIDSARARVEQATAGVRLAEAVRLELKRKQQELETRRADIERARAQAAIIESQVQDTVAVAPVGGVVLVKSAEVGEVLAAGTSVVTLGDLENPWLRGYISERDLGRVNLGTKARVTTDSFPGKVYEGRVTFIASEAEFTPKQIQTPEERVKLVYRVKVDVANPRRELKLNMPADAEILLEESGGHE